MDVADTDLYAVLNVSEQATFSDIRSAYRDLSRLYHPDKCKTQILVDRLLSVQRAYAVLSDSFLRHHYDRYGHYGLPVATDIRSYELEHQASIARTSESESSCVAEFEVFEQRVFKAQSLLDEFNAARQRNAESRLKLRIYCFALNPFISQKPRFCRASAWKCGELSVQQALGLAFPDCQANGSIAYAVGRRWRPTAFGSLSDMHMRNKVVQNLTFGRSAITLAYPFTKTVTLALEGVAESTEPCNRCDISLQKWLGPDATASVRYSIAPSLECDKAVAHAVHLEWLVPLYAEPHLTSNLSCSLASGSSVVSATLSAPDVLPFGCNLSGTLQLSNSEFLFGTFFRTPYFSGLRSRLPKKSLLSVASALRDIELLPSDSARIKLRTHIGLVSGLQIICQYSIPLHWIDPFSTLHYSIRWHPHYGWLSVEFRLQRLATAFELPIVLAWPIRRGSENGQMLNESTIRNLMWCSSLFVAFFPILLHRFWVDCLSGHSLLRKIVKAFNNNTLKGITSYRVAPLLLYLKTTVFRRVTRPMSQISQRFCTVPQTIFPVHSDTSSNPLTGVALCCGPLRFGLPRTVFMKPSTLSDLLQHVAFPTLSEQQRQRDVSRVSTPDAENNTVNQLIIKKAIYAIGELASLPPVIHQEYPLPLQQQLMSRVRILNQYDVTLPFQTHASHSTFTIPEGMPYNTLPGVPTGVDAPETPNISIFLYLRYHYNGRSYECLARDKQSLVLPV